MLFLTTLSLKCEFKISACKNNLSAKKLQLKRLKKLGFCLIKIFIHFTHYPVKHQSLEPLKIAKPSGSLRFLGKNKIKNVYNQDAIGD
ncbi:hypothetical protein [uncultured Nostoc sp.]|uniref:hypothetical protein n=1 Tax=uncultured Nostoc sp. TaxID=340711 RepID=UPI0035CC00BF